MRALLYRLFHWSSLPVVVAVIGLLSTSCQVTPTPSTGETESQETVQPEEQPAVTQETQPPQSPAEIMIWLPKYPDGWTVPQDLFAQFMDENPNIAVAVEYINPSDYLDRLRAVSQENLPSVGLLFYDALASFQGEGLLMPLDDLEIDTSRFILDALESTQFDESLYGLPWLRSGCSPDYESLVAWFDKATFEPVSRLLDFLTQTEVQEMIVEDSNWSPTVSDLDDCEKLTVRRLSPDQKAEAVAYAQEYAGVLEETQILEGRQINTFNATGLFTDQEATQSVQEIIQVNLKMIQTDQEIAQVAAPLTENPTSEEAQNSLNSEDGLIPGVMFVDQSVPEEIYGFEIPPGNYVVICRDEGETLCELDEPSGEVIADIPAEFKPQPAPVFEPVVFVEEGSEKFCWSLDSIKICIRIG